MEKGATGTHPSLGGAERAGGEEKLIRWRYFKDRLTTGLVGLGGISVLAAIVLIFFYLAYVVVPLFAPAELEPLGSYDAPYSEPGLLLAIEEQAEVATHITASGEVTFFDVANGDVRKRTRLPIGSDQQLDAYSNVDKNRGIFAMLYAGGGLLIARHDHALRFGEGQRTIESSLRYPYGEQTLPTGLSDVRELAVRADDESVMAAALTGDAEITLVRFAREIGLFGGGTDFSEDIRAQFSLDMMAGERIEKLLLDPAQAWLHALTSKGRVLAMNIRRPTEPIRLEPVALSEGEVSVVDARFLNGGISLLVTTSDEVITQLFPVRGDDGQFRLQRIRTFDTPGEASVSAVDIELRRRGFVVGDTNGELALYYATSQRRLLTRQVSDAGIRDLVLAPRSNFLLVEDNQGQIQTFAVHNEHPEVSFGAIWGKVWYENYNQPEYVWQSSSATSDFEPKFSLSPLTFGTLKAAFYAMLFAMPLAILGAIYTAYFMSSELRQLIKPTIEIMEALPTVILGFLAGLWLAPVLELNMPGFFLLLLLLPVSLPLAGYVWTRMPASVRHRVPDGWVPALLVPVIAAVVWLSFALSKPIEAWFFGGSMPLWLSNEVGIEYDQRNAIVVGLAMGFAVIPTIFSIAEDAVFSVPKHLTQGSLALGATPWQTMVRVVLPTASPGMFSAVMIGLGRAVGETMIVLMATGNTPIMDMSIFQGMRTLSANIAVEMPESEVGSTHYRMLFLAGLVLFIITFGFNTLAEIVRQRLRRKYSSL